MGGNELLEQTDASKVNDAESNKSEEKKVYPGCERVRRTIFLFVFCGDPADGQMEQCHKSIKQYPKNGKGKSQLHCNGYPKDQKRIRRAEKKKDIEP